VSAFRSRLDQIEFISFRFVKRTRNKRMIRMKAWYKVEKLEEILETDPDEMSKDYSKVCEILIRSKRGIQSWFK